MVTSFQGTTTKYTVYDRTVYLVDKLTADNRVYYKDYFRCRHSKGTLKLADCNSFEGVLYCRPHFDPLFKRTGSSDKSFEATTFGDAYHECILARMLLKSQAHFLTPEEKCFGCNKTVYPIERVTVNSTMDHKRCFECCHVGRTISPSNYIAHEGKLYCMHHHIQLIKEKGNFTQLENDHKKTSQETFVSHKLCPRFLSTYQCTSRVSLMMKLL